MVTARLFATLSEEQKFNKVDTGKSRYHISDLEDNDNKGNIKQSKVKTNTERKTHGITELLKVSDSNVKYFSVVYNHTNIIITWESSRAIGVGVPCQKAGVS